MGLCILSPHTRKCETMRLLPTLLILSSLLLTACAEPTPDVEATKRAALPTTQAAKPTATPLPPPFTPKPTDTPVPPTDTPPPTQSPIPPTDTPLPSTHTPTPTETTTSTPASESATVRVAPDGSGDFANLEAAIDAVPAGATIMLGPGSYHLAQALDIIKALTLAGAGMDETVIVSEAEDYAVSFSGPGRFAAEDITFRHEGEALADVVVVRGGEIAFARCRFIGAGPTDSGGEPMH